MRLPEPLHLLCKDGGVAASSSRGPRWRLFVDRLHPIRVLYDNDRLQRIDSDWFWASLSLTCFASDCAKASVLSSILSTVSESVHIDNCLTQEYWIQQSQMIEPPPLPNVQYSQPNECQLDRVLINFLARPHLPPERWNQSPKFTHFHQTRNICEFNFLLICIQWKQQWFHTKTCIPVWNTIIVIVSCNSLIPRMILVVGHFTGYLTTIWSREQ